MKEFLQTKRAIILIIIIAVLVLWLLFCLFGELGCFGYNFCGSCDFWSCFEGCTDCVSCMFGCE